mmetsp:Transcript_95294/g.188875  ORF Transcript_95294/g.188875 Transcript_95294/m.188875 type:complete len:183 (-) Transcript_95294:215-763(-)
MATTPDAKAQEPQEFNVGTPRSLQEFSVSTPRKEAEESAPEPPSMALPESAPEPPSMALLESAPEPPSMAALGARYVAQCIAAAQVADKTASLSTAAAGAEAIAARIKPLEEGTPEVLQIRSGSTTPGDDGLSVVSSSVEDAARAIGSEGSVRLSITSLSAAHVPSAPPEAQVPQPMAVTIA